jgi:hypothetical protein
MCIGSIVPELETSSKCFVSILPGEEIFKHTRYAAILSKDLFWILFFRPISMHYLLCQTLGCQDVPIWAKKKT